VVGFRIESYAGPGHLKTGPFDNRTYLSGFQMASLDRFIKKRVIKNMLFMTKQSRLEVKKTLVRILKSGHRKCPKNDHLKTGRSDFRMLTVHPREAKHRILKTRLEI
jgi:hypothetical protein